MLRTERLNAGYGQLHILFDVDINVEKGITAIIGPNGSGKSTLLKSIFGIATVHSGSVFLNGKDITRIPPHEKVKLGMAYLPQTENVFSNLSVKENLMIAGYGLEEETLKDRIDSALEFFPELKNHLKRRAGTLSGGERQMLAMASALVKNAKILMLDEPTAQLSPKLAEKILERVQMMRDEKNLTIMLVEQNVKKALEISENAYLLVSGRVAFSGKACELLSHPKFEKMCVGILD
ncbi:MAG: ABC transporter ATP-binding protein [Archaeoglobaceae archaeon]|nr:ABC transporter ATP-binding protein [Archaeoglobaceae archaeon]MDW8128609.1 ABC transporter ATP-binding protein [Archaeoglobaceae archaeon]